MFSKHEEKKQAIQLRERGLSYREILEQIPVAKSTLSSWLHSVHLASVQKQRLTQKKLAGMKRGWEAVKARRIKITEEIKVLARQDVGKMSRRDLWLIGVALYWAEGSKAKDHNVSQRLIFSNSDPSMLKLFIHWLKHVVGVKEEDLYFEIYIHEIARNSLKNVVKYWSNALKVNSSRLNKVYFKRGNIMTKRKNIGDNYFGLVRVSVSRSTNLNRKVTGWIEGICKNCGVV